MLPAQLSALLLQGACLVEAHAMFEHYCVTIAVLLAGGKWSLVQFLMRCRSGVVHMTTNEKI